MTEQIYEDRWGEVFDRPSADLIELRWFDTTAEMSAGEFQSWLKNFAECVEKCGRSRVLVDSTAFRMSPAKMDGPWRDANIIPRYNAAGVKKFAFHMPEGAARTAASAAMFPPAPGTSRPRPRCA